MPKNLDKDQLRKVTGGLILCPACQVIDGVSRLPLGPRSPFFTK